MFLDNIANTKVKRVLLFLLLATPVLITFFLILRYGVNLFYPDEISDIVYMTFREDVDGAEYLMTFQRLFAQHNEHRIFLPKLVYIAIARLTSLDYIAIMLASQMIVTAAYIAICRFVCHLEKSNLKYPMMLLIGFLMFSLVQYENIFQAFQINFYMVNVFAVLSMYFMQRSMIAGDKDWSFLTLSILCAIITSFSSTNGLFVWIAVDFGYLLHYRLKAFKCVRFWVWNAFAAFSWIFYFSNYHFLGSGPSPLSVFDNPLRSIMHFFAAIGRTLSADPIQSAVFGVLIIAVCSYILYSFIKNNNKLDFLSIAMITFGLLFILSVAVGRAGFGVVSRYTTYSLCIIIGICLFLFNGRLAHWGSRTIIAFIAVLCIASQGSSALEILDYNETRSEAKEVFINYRESSDDELFNHLFLNPQGAREFAALMEKYEAGPFKDVSITNGD